MAKRSDKRWPPGERCYRPEVSYPAVEARPRDACWAKPVARNGLFKGAAVIHAVVGIDVSDQIVLNVCPTGSNDSSAGTSIGVPVIPWPQLRPCIDHAIMPAAGRCPGSMTGRSRSTAARHSRSSPGVRCVRYPTMVRPGGPAGPHLVFLGGPDGINAEIGERTDQARAGACRDH